MNEHNRGIFNRWAQGDGLNLKTDPYSQVRTRTRGEFLKKYGTGKQVLDLGCGQGEFSCLAYRYFSRIVGIDFSEGLLKKAYKKMSLENITNLKLIQADAACIPFEDNSFDMVFSFSTLEYIEDQGVVLREMQRVLKSGGFAIFDLGNVLSLNRLLNLFCSDLQVFNLLPFQMKRLIKEANFKIIEHHLFQLFPMFGGWWVPFSSEFWRKIFARKLGERTIDEIISSLPALKFFSFRHFFVCKK